MCHLAGYIGTNNAAPILLESIRAQEAIIGAQATGLAVLQPEGIQLAKAVGPHAVFLEKLALDNFQATIGICHTRHSLKNLLKKETNTREKAHPFWNSDKTFVTMHNGTISNYMIFVEKLEKIGYTFRSKSTFYDQQLNQKVTDYCDSEIFSFLLEEELKKDLALETAIRNACRDIRGHYAFVILHPAVPDKIYIANWMQPMYLAYNKDSSFFCSFEVGYSPVMQSMPWKFTPPKNSLICLSRGRINVQPLLPDRPLPNFSEKDLLESAVLQALDEEPLSIAEIGLFFSKNPHVVDLGPADFDAVSTVGGLTFTPLIYTTLDTLEKKGKVSRRIDVISEGAVKALPRMLFTKIA